MYIAQNMQIIIDPSTRTKPLNTTDIKIEWYNENILKLIQKAMFHTFAEKTEATAGFINEFITFFWIIWIAMIHYFVNGSVGTEF